MQVHDQLYITSESELQALVDAAREAARSTSLLPSLRGAPAHDACRRRRIPADALNLRIYTKSGIAQWTIVDGVLTAVSTIAKEASRDARGSL